MADDLGERLVRVGLLTRAALSEALESAPTHGAEMARSLFAHGLSEDALAGFFVSEGFGPVLEARDLALADPNIQKRLSTGMATEFLVYPVRDTTAGVVVAMATPTDRHIIDETRRALGREVVPTVARAGDIERTIVAQRPDAKDGRERKDSEPPVLELTRRRPSAPGAGGYQGRAPSAEPAAKLGPRVSISPSTEPDAEAPLLLVRHKAIPRDQSKPAIPLPAVDESKPSIPLAPKTFGKPKELKPKSEGDRTITGEYASGRPSAVSAPPKPTSLPAGPPETPGRPSRSIDEAVQRLTPQKPFERPDPNARPEPSLWAKAKPPSVAPKSPAPAKPASLAPSRPSAAAKLEARAEAKGEARSEKPTQPPRKSEKPSADPKAAPKIVPASEPPGDKWSDLPAPSVPPAENKVARASLVGSKAAAGDIGPVLSGIKTARDRDAVVRLACDGAITVARAAVFLALKKGVLKGWDGAGSGISRDSVRNLWIPAGSASMFKKVLDEGVAYVGPYGAGIADGLFKAAVGSRGGDVMVQPVLLEGKVVGLLCVDDLRPGPLARGRVETLSTAVGEAFRRVISAGKE